MAISTFNLQSDQRNQVLFLGENVPNELLSYAEILDKSIRIKKVSVDEIKTSCSISKALLIEIVPEKDIQIDKLKLAISIALQNGLKIIVMCLKNLSIIERDHFFRQIIILNEIFGSRIHHEQTIEKILHEIIKHSPGMGYNSEQIITGEIPENEHEILLKRSFNDLKGFHLSKISGGKSGASVWLVEPNDEDKGYCDVSFIAKIQEISRGIVEDQKFQAISMSFQNRYRAHLYLERNTSGFEYTLSAYQTVLKAKNLSNIIHIEPKKLILSLFNNTFNDSWSRKKSKFGSFSSIFNSQLGITRFNSKDLIAASISSKINRQNLPDLTHIEKIFNNLPSFDYNQVTIHGDLHPGNIYVVDDILDCILIDFGRVSRDAPIVVDPACLEISLTFPSNPEFDLSLLDNSEWKNWICNRYKYPLNTSTNITPPAGYEWLDEAVFCIRDVATSIESTVNPYAIAVAAFLLRCASYADHDIRQRSLAYELACDLIYAVREALT
jgi:thiamine kinase-like enzyme